MPHGVTPRRDGATFMAGDVVEGAIGHRSQRPDKVDRPSSASGSWEMGSNSFELEQTGVVEDPLGKNKPRQLQPFIQGGFNVNVLRDPGGCLHP